MLTKTTTDYRECSHLGKESGKQTRTYKTSILQGFSSTKAEAGVMSKY